MFALGDPESSTTVAEGLFVSSDPAVGDLVDVGATVTVRFSSGPGSVTIPDLFDWSQEDAVAELERLGLELNASRESVNHCEVEEGRVVATTPEAGETADEGATVTLSISNGRCLVPNVVGKPLADAKSELEGVGFVVNSDTREDSEAEPGTVLEQDPRATSEARQGETIHLIVAEAVAKVTIPADIVGQQGSYVQGRLEGQGVRVVIEPRESQEPAGIILGSDPEPGTDVDEGSTVTLFVSSGPPPDPTPPEDNDDEDGGEG